MRASRCGLVVALALLSSFAVAQPSDQVIAERVLGPRWKQLSRRSSKEAKKQQKMLNKANKKQRKAMKKAAKAQRKATRKANRRRR